MQVRTRILDAALGLLAEGGELTQPRVSKAAGVRQSHLTYYFPTITDLLQAVARHSLDKLAGELGSAADRRKPGSLAEGLAHGTTDKKRVRMMLGLVMAADRDASLRPRMRSFVDEIRGRFAPLLQTGGLAVGEAEIAFLHSVVVGCAVLQLARDNPAARKEAREVLAMAVAFLERGRKE